MWYRLALIGGPVRGIGGGAASAADTKQEQPPPEAAAKGATAEKAGVIEPKADAELHRMSDYLSSLKTFRVDTTTVDETKVNKDGQKIQVLADSQFAIRRPGEMRIDRVGPNGRVVFRDDGKQFSVVNSDKNIYATAPAPAKLDQAADDARRQLQVDAPGVDLLASNPYDALTDGITGARYIGLVPMGGGVMAHQIAVTKKNVNYQIWIKDGPQPLPLRYVVTGQDMRGSPQFTIQLHNWQPNAEVPDSSFAFTPPAGAHQGSVPAPQGVTTGASYGVAVSSRRPSSTLKRREAIAAARPSMPVYVGNESGMRASSSTRMPAAIAIAACLR